jgi:methylenetetrahydrofolate dehydrogenase (NADP+)/methenyltetrahydrofolate cyclohydrolase
MPAKIIDGKAIAQGIRADLKAKIDPMPQKPGLAIVMAGENPASQTYVRLKMKTCGEIGITSEKHELPENVSEDELLGLIEKLNNDSNVHGIIVQMPVPKQIDSVKVMSAISPEKDVDGFNPVNLGGLLTGTAKFESATAKGIMRLLKETGIELKGKDICLIGWGITVGKPLSNMLLAKNATLTVCHEFTHDLPAHTKNADVIISATGVPNLIKAGMVKEGAIIIDAGCGMLEGKLCGDVDYEAVRAVASWITPVPGGVGPMTIAMLLSNVVDASA